MKKVRILVADDHEMMRRGLRTVLEKRPDWEVCCEAANGQEAVEKARKLKPDIVVMDIAMPKLNGLEATSQILKAVPEAQIVVLTAHESEILMRKALEAGVRGYVLKSDAGRDLVSAVEAICQHKLFFTPNVSEMVLQDYLKLAAYFKVAPSADRNNRADPLSARQLAIVELLAQGKTNKEIANTLGISVRTVETHRVTLKRKLKLNSLSDLIRYAIRNKIVEL